MQVEIDRLNTEVENLREQLRNVKAEHSAAKKVVDEKDFTINTLEDNITRLKQDVEIHMSKVDAKETEIMEQNLHYEEMLAKEQQLKQDLEE
ncbi:unnamed protein product, partial [Cylicostephanus goldi]